MKLYEYYKLRTNEDGKPELYIIPDPLPQDGYSYEPLAYANDEEEYDEEYIAKRKLPFTGLDTNFSGDHGDIQPVEIISGIDVDVMDHINKFMADEPIWPSRDPAGYIFYRTGIYYPDEEYTGLDVIYCIVLDY